MPTQAKVLPKHACTTNRPRCERGCARRRPRPRQDRSIRAVTPRSKKGRDAVRAPQAHSPARQIAPARTQRRPVRVHAGSNRTESEAARQTCSSPTTGHVHGAPGESVAVPSIAVTPTLRPECPAKRWMRLPLKKLPHQSTPHQIRLLQQYRPYSEAPTAAWLGPLSEVDLPLRRSDWHGSFWPIATGDILTARGRVRGIADMKQFSAPDDL
jgi:hypothetical protein